MKKITLLILLTTSCFIGVVGMEIKPPTTVDMLMDRFFSKITVLERHTAQLFFSELAKELLRKAFEINSSDQKTTKMKPIKGVILAAATTTFDRLAITGMFRKKMIKLCLWLFSIVGTNDMVALADLMQATSPRNHEIDVKFPGLLHITKGIAQSPFMIFISMLLFLNVVQGQGNPMDGLTIKSGPATGCGSQTHGYEPKHKAPEIYFI